MRLDACLPLLLCLDSCSRSDPAEATPATGGIRFDFTRKELGPVWQQSRITEAFPFTVGSKPVLLSGLDTSCGCLQAQLAVEDQAWPLDRPLPAGTRGSALLTMDTRRYRGPYSVNARIHGDDGALLAALELAADVQVVFRIEPERVDFGELDFEADFDAERTQVVTIRGIEPFSITGWQHLPPWIRVEDLPLEDGAGSGPSREHRLRVTLAEQPPTHRVLERIAAETSLGRTLEFSLQARILEPVQYEPGRRLFLGRVAEGAIGSEVLRIRSGRDGRPIPPPQLEIAGDTAFRADCVARPGENGYDVTVQLDAGAGKGHRGAVLRVRFPEASMLPPADIQLAALVR